MHLSSAVWRRNAKMVRRPVNARGPDGLLDGHQDKLSGLDGGSGEFHQTGDEPAGEFRKAGVAE